MNDGSAPPNEVKSYQIAIQVQGVASDKVQKLTSAYATVLASFLTVENINPTGYEPTGLLLAALVWENTRPQGLKTHNDFTLEEMYNYIVAAMKDAKKDVVT